MIMAARGLGKGLDSLIPNTIGEAKEKKESKEKVENKNPETMVKLSMVEPNGEQPRKNFDEDSLLELAESIKQFGLLQPIIVQDRKNHYEIIAGERRWRAAKMAGLKEIPVIIKNLTNQEIVEISLIENIQREDLNPIEEAQAYKRLLEEFNLKQDEVAERVSKSRTAVTNSMRLLKLCDEVQQMVVNEMISTGHARALLSIEDPEEQYMIAQKVFDEKMSVREVEKLVKDLHKPEKAPKKENKSLEVIYQNIENRLKESLGTKVSISPKNNGAGKIEIEFYNHDDLDRLMEQLMRA
ncbi:MULTISPECIES: ParB/RepB/Spo0J family partition protein [Eisenbergiella]|jgi:ParB family chromosome partitioning protein|uniref:ParB/RepB/Spo0J family partition protein n=1 Tax=Eisenbergiella massiliensis TaxID=1720294 RepID=A0A3E3ICP8_9FIRM|nr:MULTISPECIES: ParB/RepB/Spo0J family partition protein [Eisenbergiella]MDU5291128.1 ParB/RepB/Spo0J family partition protein [Clostridium sp.]RGE64818.1 ParB/RepB/Spo0J family partition protein [Eisenbergiella massiliensis]RGE67188.1 ParB/RepB/Spo0J family partition protein [Eisenbergiella massiliensis]